jgi:hypothetical protein
MKMSWGNCSVKMSSPHGDHDHERQGSPRPGLVRSVSAGLITNRQAAEALGLTLRKARFRADGVGGLVHRGRGQPSPRRLADPVRAQIPNLMTTVYERMNDGRALIPQGRQRERSTSTHSPVQPASA